MNEFELYPASKAETMEFVQQGSNITAFFRKKILAAKFIRVWREVYPQAGKSVGKVCSNSGKKNSEFMRVRQTETEMKRDRERERRIECEDYF